MDGGRRAFLRGSLLTREGRTRERLRLQPLGPPPPWHRDQPLAEACPDCTHPCVAACGPRIIRLHPQNHRLAGVPYLDFNSAGCTFCAACVGACPLDVGPADSGTDRPHIGRAHLNREACLAWNGVICQSCSERCEYHAITTDRQRRVHIDAETCTGCGMCVTACPVSALGVRVN